MTTGTRPTVDEVEVQPVDPARLEPLIGEERMATFLGVADRARDLLDGRPVWNVNSTAVGGGVAELLQTLLAYARGVAVEARWLVIKGDPAFFAITKRIHNGLYGSPGDGGELADAERRHYERILRPNADDLIGRVLPGDVVLLHDPQTAGLAERLRDAGARVVWRCHVGSDLPNEWTERAWEFLRPYVEHAEAFVFTRAEFAPPWIDAGLVYAIPPSLDPFSAKNQAMSTVNIRPVLGHVGLIDGSIGPPKVPFTRRDGTPGRVTRFADVLQNGSASPAHAPLVLQASRWDRMKDMAGVMSAFAAHVDRAFGAHLVLAGPAVHGVADDPEAAEVLDECTTLWRALPHEARHRIHLACVPMTDPDEAAAIVNALQRHAAVVVQKSLAEGFGLTVTEAMWKGRPVVASGVGGIVDQIDDGKDGLLVDPRDSAAFGECVSRLLADEVYALELGRAARRRVVDEMLGDRHLARYGHLLGDLLDPRSR